MGVGDPLCCDLGWPVLIGVLNWAHTRRQGTLSLRVKGTGLLDHTGRLLHHASVSPFMQWDKWLSETQTTDMERLLLSRERVAIRAVLLFEGRPRAAIKSGV